MIIYGASGHGLVIQDILEKSGISDISYIDDQPKLSWGNRPVHKSDSKLMNPETSLILAIGNNNTRKRLSAQLKADFGKAIHPSAVLAIEAHQIGQGTVIMAGVIINPAVKIGEHCIINTAATIDHECILEDFVHISPNATLCGDVVVGEGTHIGAGAVIIQCLRIGKWATIGAGSVIIHDVPDYAVVVGNPGRIVRYVKPPGA